MDYKPGTTKLSELLKFGLMGCSFYYICCYLLIAGSRLFYPFELEWMEGGAADHVDRVLAGLPLYVEPSIDFIPYIYTPFFFYLSAGIAKLTGMGFVPLRLVSILASIGILLLLFQFGKRESKSNWLGWLCAGLFAATFREGGAWLDIGRVDSLFLFLILAATFLIRFKPTIRSHIAAGILMTLAFLTKQSALPGGILLGLYCLIFLPKKLKTPFLSSFAVLTLTSIWFFNKQTNGWFHYYIFEIPGQHALDWNWLIDYWTKDLGVFSFGILFGIFYLIQLFRKKRWTSFGYYFVLGGMLIGLSWLSRMHTGSYDNVLIPAFAAVSLLAGLGFHILTQHHTFFKKITTVNSKKLIPVVAMLALVQFALLWYHPIEQIPTKADRQAGNQFIEKLNAIKGAVFVPDMGYLPKLAGKQTFAHRMAIADVLRAEDSDIKDRFSQHLKSELLSNRFEAYFLHFQNVWNMEHNPAFKYIQTDFAFDEPDVFKPVTGLAVRPEFVLERQQVMISEKKSNNHEKMK